MRMRAPTPRRAAKIAGSCKASRRSMLWCREPMIGWTVPWRQESRAVIGRDRGRPGRRGPGVGGGCGRPGTLLFPASADKSARQGRRHRHTCLSQKKSVSRDIIIIISDVAFANTRSRKEKKGDSLLWPLHFLLSRRQHQCCLPSGGFPWRESDSRRRSALRAFPRRLVAAVDGVRRIAPRHWSWPTARRLTRGLRRPRCSPPSSGSDSRRRRRHRVARLGKTQSACESASATPGHRRKWTRRLLRWSCRAVWGVTPHCSRTCRHGRHGRGCRRPRVSSIRTSTPPRCCRRTVSHSTPRRTGAARQTTSGSHQSRSCCWPAGLGCCIATWPRCASRR
jgi:hypothetical protein